MNTTRDNFVDFIPEGQEKGSPYGIGGFIDYVPAPEPKPLPVSEKPVKKSQAKEK
jgi:hypothetical protein